jgi:hypothetical protein
MDKAREDLYRYKYSLSEYFRYDAEELLKSEA